LAADSETKTDTNLINDAEKLLIYSIGKIHTNLSKLQSLSTEERPVSANFFYIHALRQVLEPLLENCGANKVLNSLLPKLLFRNMNILYNFYEYGFRTVGKCKPPSSAANDREEIKKYFEKIKVSLLIYFKTLLKEFNLMEFYKQAADMSGIKVDTDFNEKNIEKIETINNLLNCIGKIVQYHSRRGIISIVHDCYYFENECENIPSVIYFILFYYWIKITNSLLKQYKETIDDEELKQKINIKFYRYLSLVIIFLCVGQTLLAAHRLIKFAYLSSGSTLIEHIRTYDVKKLLGKMSESLNKVCLTMICDEEDVEFLRVQFKKFSSKNEYIKQIIKIFFIEKINHILRDLEESLFKWKSLPIYIRSKSDCEDLYYIIRAAGEIRSVRDTIYAVIYN